MQTQLLLNLSSRQFMNQVKDLLRHFLSPHQLMESPFLQTELIWQAGIWGEYAREMDRVRTLQAVLRWTVAQLAPHHCDYAIGAYRPPDDPTWCNPAWWSYNLLRHKYLEPVPPDEFFEGSGRRETLCALTGIPSRSVYYSELNRAVQTIARILRNELTDPQASRTIQRQLLSGMLETLKKKPASLSILGVAATFTKAFPRRLLQEMVESERIPAFFPSLDILTAERFLVELDGASHLIVPPAIRECLLPMQNPKRLKQRCVTASEDAGKNGQIPDQIQYLQETDFQQEALKLLTENWGTLSSRCHFQALLDIINGFNRHFLTPEQWLRVQLTKGSHLIRFGYFETAREIFKQIRNQSQSPDLKRLALIFLAHACSSIDPDAAERYYRLGEMQLGESLECAQFLYSSRGRFHLDRNELDLAEKYLHEAMHAPSHPQIQFKSVLLFALTDLYMVKADFPQALQFAGELIDYAEAEGDDHLYALSLGTTGKIYLAMQDYAAAMRYFQKSEVLHRRRFNMKETSRILQYQGTIYESTGQLNAAVQVLEESLTMQEHLEGQNQVRVSLHQQLAELYRRIKSPEQASRHLTASVSLETLPEMEHWLKNSSACQTALEMLRQNQVISAGELARAAQIGPTTSCKVLAGLTTAGRVVRYGKGRATRYALAIHHSDPANSINLIDINQHAQWIMEFVRKTGYITSKIVQNQRDISAATAKRALSQMVTGGILKRCGAGRACRYLPAF